MKLKDLFEMPQHIPREMDDTDMTEPMTAFFVTDERLAQKYKLLNVQDNVEVYLNKDLSSACIGLRTKRHDGKSGIMLYGDIQFKSHVNLGFDISRLEVSDKKILQVDIVSVVKERQFEGSGSVLYSSIVQDGFTIISDNKQFDGGKQLWKKIGRSHLSNENVYVINSGNVMMKDNKPISYNGFNIPDDEIWSADKQKEFVLFMYMKN